MKRRTLGFAVRRLTLRDALQSWEWDAWRESNASDMPFADPDRYDRCASAAEWGGDGSTPGEVLADEREFIDAQRLPSRVKARILAEIDSAEEWHEAHGTLDAEIG